MYYDLTLSNCLLLAPPKNTDFKPNQILTDCMAKYKEMFSFLIPNVHMKPVYAKLM